METKSNTTRRFRLIEEFEAAEKGKDSNLFSLGLEDPEDRSLTYWNGMIFGPNHTKFQDRFLQLHITCGPQYPLSPPKIKFLTKVNLPSVNKSTGEVMLQMIPLTANWKTEVKLADIIMALKDEMVKNGKLDQPPEGATF